MVVLPPPRPSLLMFIPKPTRPLVLRDLLVPSGEARPLSLLLAVLLPLLRVLVTTGLATCPT